MKSKTMFLAVTLATTVIPRPSPAIELHRATLDAWNNYVQDADLRMSARLAPANTFLWIDEAPGRDSRLRTGEILVAPLAGRGIQEVPGGLIHHWLGAAFFPNATAAGVLTILHRYETYTGLYKPVVTEAHPLGCITGDQEFSMTWQRHVLFVNAAMQAHYRSHDVALTGTRGYNITDAARVQEIEDFGRAGQRLLPAGAGKGFLWRIHSIMRYEQRGGGLYVELEVMALTRDIPSSLRWLVNPVVNHLSVDSLTTTLQQTRTATLALPLDQTYTPACNGTGGAEAFVTPNTRR